MLQPSSTINWLKLLHSYAPVLSNRASLAEKVAKVEKETEAKRIEFEHPAKVAFMEALEAPRCILLLGTAGDGKTSLMIEGKANLLGGDQAPQNSFEEFSAHTKSGTTKFVFVYDLSGWRAEHEITLDQLAFLYRFADAVAGKSEEIFVIAANDGILHQILQDDLPPDMPQTMQDLRGAITGLHEKSRQIASDAQEPLNLRLINLSLIRSEQIMQHSLDAILDRPEWTAPEFGSGTGILSQDSTVYRNYSLLKSSHVRRRLVTLAKLADACRFHLSIRDCLCLIANSILGHPRARNGVLRADAENSNVSTTFHHEAALHKTLFGDALKESTRAKRLCYVFLTLLQIGQETTNELDDLLIFGNLEQEEPKIREKFASLVAPDPYGQRDQNIDNLSRQYVNGDITDEECQTLRSALVSERRRLFLTSTDENFAELQLWNCTAFHHAGKYLDTILAPLRTNKAPSPSLIRKIVGGLNRIWTGFLLTEDADVLYLCTGLDVTTAPVSDLILGEIHIDGFNGDDIRLILDEVSQLPRLVFDLPSKREAFGFIVTLQRFEFLMRVAGGAMPTSFSRESTEDFSVLKQRCIRDLCKTAQPTLQSVAVDDNGKMSRCPIHL